MKSIVHYTELYEHSSKEVETHKWTQTFKGPLPSWLKDHLNKECERAKFGQVDYDKTVDVKDDPDNLCIIIECRTKPTQDGQVYS